MRSTISLIGLLFLLLIGAPTVGAQEPGADSLMAGEDVDCVDEAFLSTALVDCVGRSTDSMLDLAAPDQAAVELETPSDAGFAASAILERGGLPAYCRRAIQAVFWGGNQWFELAQALARDYSECAEYYVSVPPNDGNRTQLRVRPRFDEIRELDAPIHPVAEIRWTSDTGWRRWVVGPTHRDGWVPGRTFYGAGVEARRRMAQRGLDVTAGETWAFNELTEEVLTNAPGARAEVLEFLRGLYDGLPGMPKARGIVFNVAPRSDLTDLTAYKEQLKSWLEDEPFWTELDIFANFFAHEVYVSPSVWGVAGAPRATRAEYLNDYFHHPMILADEGPETVEAARSFLRRTYVPLANAAWPHLLIGNTSLLTDETMRQFISTQVYAIRHYSNSHPQTSPQGRIGFAWAPVENVPGYSVAGVERIGARLASAIHQSSEEGGNSQMGACGPPGEHVWCTGDVPGAALNGVWKIFTSWE